MDGAMRLRLLGLFSCFCFVACAAAQQPHVLWRFNATNDVVSSPAIGPDGTIYFGAGDSDLFAVRPEGSLKWIYRTNDIFAAAAPMAPSVGDDGTIYAAFSRVLVALNPEGTVKWKFSGLPPAQLDGYGPALAADGSILLAPAGGAIKLRPDGSQVWRQSKGTQRGSFPALSASGVLYHAWPSAGALAYGGDGTLFWQTTGYPFQFDPAMGSDGTIYGAYDLGFMSLSPAGKVNWTFAAIGHAQSAVIDAAGDIYFGTDQSFLYALKPDRMVKWLRAFSWAFRGAAAIDRDGMIYICDESANLHSLTAGGTTNWVLNIGVSPFLSGQVFSSPVIADDGTIYIGVMQTLVAVAGAAPPAQSAWPMHRHDARHTGRLSAPPPEAPTLSVNRTATASRLQIGVEGEPGRAYTVLASTNLQQWSAYTNLFGPTNRHVFEINATGERRFLRGAGH
jgi:outer membrane protein assembly factor BamB